MFGALSLSTQKFYWKQAPTGNTQYFKQFLYQLHQAFPEKKLAMVVDNSSIHHAKTIQAFATRHDWLSLHFLPTYSPEYNPIERFWKWLRKVVYGAASYIKVEDVIRQLRKLIWHYNEKWLATTIRFQFKAYAALL